MDDTAAETRLWMPTRSSGSTQSAAHSFPGGKREQPGHGRREDRPMRQPSGASLGELQSKEFLPPVPTRRIATEAATIPARGPRTNTPQGAGTHARQPLDAGREAFKGGRER